MQVKVAESVPKRHVSFEERYIIEPMEVVLSRCVCVKEKKLNFRFSYRCISSKQISAWKIPPSNLSKQ